MFAARGALLFSAILSLAVCQDPYINQPRLVSRDGHLEIRPALHRNVTILTSGSGRVNINQVDLNDLVDRATHGLSPVSGGGGAPSERLLQLERAVRQLQDRQPVAPGQAANNAPLATRVRVLEEGLQRLIEQLQLNECASNPCQNGATCVDRYGAFECQCPPNWQGTTCEVDVDECSELSGTDLGCQNGATCSNTAGAFSCQCPSGWYGQRCTERSSNCSSANERQLCGHGTCVSQADGHKCICEQGWRRASGSDSAACTEDVNECADSRPACSHDPPVPCINTPGSFRCGACPAGYTGNGFSCTDVDECLQYNGGCSMNPMVDCFNTRGWRRCGACPAGYQGNGVVCRVAAGGICGVGNGGCHPLAQCYHNPAISASHVQCTCPSGYAGSGLGPAGCVTRARCDMDVNECQSSPCQNGATCSNTVGSFACTCSGDYTGPLCQTRQQACGGALDSPGALSFPHMGVTYPHEVSCAWLIRAPPDKVLNVTFTRFQLEPSSGSCRYDWLQVIFLCRAGAGTAAMLLCNIPHRGC
ncbi:cubilin homolog [Pollicipes pollicipes]|uniref:cubilin homolog n=1 Tax=Pollicipes pollicipes TaxID=41117 RepID=UPI0018849BB7|nr:cubilin homolog [Pollicipes pollicipes]